MDVLSNQRIVYKIFCEDCEDSYMGQMKRKLKIRLLEHKLDINKNTGSPTVITNHRIQYNHNFDWSNVKILDKELSYKKKLIFEMVRIKKQSLGLNKQSGSDSLHDSYLSIIQPFFLF